MKKVVCFYGDSFDGIVGAKIVSYFLHTEEVPITFVRSYFTQPLDYKGIELDKETKVCFVAYSPRVDTMEDIISIVGSGNILWFDCNRLAIENYNRYQYLNYLSGIRDTEGRLCAAEIAWLYLSDKQARMTNKIGRLILQINTRIFNLEVDEELAQVRGMIPLPTQLVGDYYTKSPVEGISTTSFYFGIMGTMPPMEEDSNYWDRFCVPGDYSEDIEVICSAGGFVEKIEDANNPFQNLEEFHRIAFPATIRKFDGVSVIAVNYPIIGKDIFKIVQDKYHIGCIFYYDGRQMIYRIYRLGFEPDEFIDCARIARSYGSNYGTSDKAVFMTSGTLVLTPVIQ